MVQYTYTLGAAGERHKVTELDRTVEYTYDNLYRLTSETITEGEKVTTYTYAYDNVSNRILKTVDGKETVYTYNALNQLVTENDITYEYDLNGNTVRMTSPTKSALYVYNADNRLIRATVQSGNNVSVEEYKYDYAGNRIAKSSEGDYTKYLLDVNGSLTYVLAELNYDGTEKCFYTRGTDLVSQERDGKKSYYVYDGHGSVRALFNEDGKVTDRYVYDAFGNLISSIGSTKNDFLFCGEQFDPVTGLYYLRARYMNPSVGTFISMDSYQGSIDDPVSLHKYLYANSNPVMYIDPSGYFVQSVVYAISYGIEWVAESQYNKAVVAIGLILLSELIYYSSTHESLILKVTKLLCELEIKVLTDLVTWNGINEEIAVETVNYFTESDKESVREKIRRKIPNGTLIFRSGSGNNNNLTPRMEKDMEKDGLSYQLTIPFSDFTVTTREMVNSTGVLEARINGVNHCSVYPRFFKDQQIEEWRKSRNRPDFNTNPHPYTKILRSISLRFNKKWNETRFNDDWG